MKLNYFFLSFSRLDIEGAEFPVFSSLPLDKVDIKVFFIDHNGSEVYKKELTKVANAKGYVVARDISKQNVVFVRKDAVKNYNKAFF